MTSPNAALTKEEVVKVAKLASLTLTSQQTDKFHHDLSAVLDYFSNLRKLNTKAVKETHQVTQTTNVFRPDEIDTKRVLPQDLVLKNAEKTHQGYFVVPALLKNR